MNSYLLAELSISTDEEHGPMLVLDNWEHIDYIEDVLCEHFGVEYEYKIIDEENNQYVLYFGVKANGDVLVESINSINTYHKETGGIYATI
jgi:hypothetical protein